ncbi:MAG: nicotinic acid mononucleotide adenylyltransferase, partial [Deltaproteobacteria bacterium]|nr:nicotinic acid mononucleotide adenylyltransferase [Deltaproteobacteria bacterium]
AISASDIRNRVKEGKSIRYLVPLQVESYIKKRGLYRGRREGR